MDDVDYLLGAHTGGQNAELSDIIPGCGGSLATVKYDVVFSGRAAHAGAGPQLGKNALMAASTAVLNLYGIPRHSGGATRINVGKLIAGSGRNVICDEAFMEIEVRGETTELCDYVDETPSGFWRPQLLCTIALSAIRLWAAHSLLLAICLW